jgi:hypothetical protein
MLPMIFSAVVSSKSMRRALAQAMKTRLPSEVIARADGPSQGTGVTCGGGDSIESALGAAKLGHAAVKENQATIKICINRPAFGEAGSGRVRGHGRCIIDEGILMKQCSQNK